MRAAFLGTDHPRLVLCPVVHHVAVAAGERVGVLFGPERAGLESADVVRASAVVSVPVNPAFGSLNLAQAVILCAYEWSKQHAARDGAASDLVQPTIEDLLPPAPQEEFEGMFGQLCDLLEPRGYFQPESRAASTRRTLRTMLTKPAWNHLEIRTLRGVLSTLRRTPGEKPAQD
jgi:tRNA/rRNA methyltransferase